MKNGSCIRSYLYRNPFVVTWLLSIGTFWCSFTINGIYNVAMENLLRRYELSATYMSSVTACYGLIQCLVVIPVSYRFGRKWKAKVIGASLVLFSIGCFCFTLPHVLSEAYIPIKSTECKTSTCEAKLHRIRYLFNFAYILLGAGNVPMYTLTLSYIHENNIFGKISTNHHYAWYHMNTAFGPAVGMLVGGQFSKVWVDWYDKALDQPEDITMDSKLWVGSWWLGYWISGFFIFLLGIFILLFVPEKLKTRDRTKDDLVVRAPCGRSRSSLEIYSAGHRLNSRADLYPPNAGASHTSTRSDPIKSDTSHATAISGLSYQEVFDNPGNMGEGHDWSDLISSYKRLLSNRVFLAVCAGTAVDMAFVSIVSMYGLIYLSEIYNIPQDISSLIFSGSLATVMLALPGSSFATRKLDPLVRKDVKKALHLIRILAICSGVSLLTLFMMCDDTEYNFAGGNVKYDSLKNSLQSTWTATKDHDGFDGFNPELHGTCSNDEDRACPCSTEDFAPVCANMSVDQGHWKRITFFSPCHLGCRFDRLQRTIKVDAIQKRTTDIQSMVDDCKCAAPDVQITFGPCSTYDCDWRIYIILPGLVLSCFFTFFQVVPGTIVTQAIVPDHLRSAALGLNALIYRVFGTIPMPIIAAKIIDSQCIWWSTTCQKEKGACRAFDKYGLSSSYVTIILILKILGIISFSFGIYHVDRLTHLKEKGANKK